MGGWVVDRKMEEDKAVRMRYCELGILEWVGGWVGGWMGFYLVEVGAGGVHPTQHQSGGDVALWRGGWVGGWVSG